MLKEIWIYKEEDVEATERKLGITAITPRSKELFWAYAKDAWNWEGVPLVGGNIPNTKEDRGNLTQLKKLGLIETGTTKEPGMPACTWLYFTEKGRIYAMSFGINISLYE